MIAITERAAAGLQELLAINHAQPGQGVKLVPSGTGRIGMTISEPGEGDAVVDHEGAPLLIVDGGIADSLDGTQIDCEISPAEGQPKLAFTLRPPER
jgi:Fe-S cluster assembly iron-binding protein IscA